LGKWPGRAWQLALWVKLVGTSGFESLILPSPVSADKRKQSSPPFRLRLGARPSVFVQQIKFCSKIQQAAFPRPRPDWSG